MPKLEIEQFPCLSDNYAVLIHDAESGLTASIDAPDAKAILERLDAKGWRLTHVLNTHHHGDHTGGNQRLKEVTGCTIIGPLAEADRIPGIDIAVSEGDEIPFGAFKIKVIDTPGHTVGHIAYWIPEARVVFVGDTLFAMGAGRIFEGNAEMMWNSLKKLMALPRRHGDLLRARVYLRERALCAHRRSRERRAAEPRQGSRPAARQEQADAADAARPGARDKPVPAAARDRHPRHPRHAVCARLEGVCRNP